MFDKVWIPRRALGVFGIIYGRLHDMMTIIHYLQKASQSHCEEGIEQSELPDAECMQIDMRKGKTEWDVLS